MTTSCVFDQKAWTNIVDVCTTTAATTFCRMVRSVDAQIKFRMRSYFAGLKHRDLRCGKESASLGNGGAGGNNSWPEIGDNTALDEKSVAFVCVQRTPRSTQDVSSAAF